MQDDGHRQAGAQADEGNQEINDAYELRGAEQLVSLQRHERNQDCTGKRIAGEKDDERARARILEVAEQDRGVDSPHLDESFRPALQRYIARQARLRNAFDVASFTPS
jgi:hypothetical protein